MDLARGYQRLAVCWDAEVLDCKVLPANLVGRAGKSLSVADIVTEL